MTTAAPPFGRTTCSCPDCVRCCHEQPGSCAPGDVERIADYLGLPVRVASLRFVASPGALVGHRLTGQVIRIGTITPKRRNGRCVFLDEADRCTVHAVAPFGCAYFDTHMAAEDAQPIGLWLAQAQTDTAYQSLRRTLPEATHYKPRSY
jgi:Fe-S-cluster containining protein